MVYISTKDKNVELTIYSEDTQTDIIERIAYQLDTLPEYLYIENPQDLTESKEPVQVHDLLHIVLNTRNIFTDIDEYKDMFDPLDIAFLYLLTRNPGEQSNFIAMVDVMNPDLYDELDYKFNRNTLTTDEFFRELEQKKNDIRKRQQELLNVYNKINLIPLYNNVTPYQKTFANIIMTFTKETDDLNVVFDNLITNEHIPLITFRYFYKIVKQYIPPENWDSSYDTIILKYRYDTTKYATITIKHVENNNFTIQMDTSIHYDAKKIMTSIINAVDIIKTEEGNQGGYFTTDVVINNNVVSHLMFVDSLFNKNITTSDKRVHVQHGKTLGLFYKNNDKHVKCSISLRKSKSNEYYPINTEYTYINILRATDIDAVNSFIEFLRKILTEYIRQYNTIVQLFKYMNLDYNPTPIIQSKDVTHASRVPPIFGGKSNKKGWTTYCQKKKHPVIIDEKEEMKGMKDGNYIVTYRDKKMKTFRKQVNDDNLLIFPKKEDGNPLEYACVDKPYNYPSLIPFTSELNTIGFAPCCAIKKDSSLLKNYFEGIESDDKRIGTYFSTTDKIIKYGRYGMFPSSSLIKNDIGAMFNMINIDGVHILRRGVNRGVNSFLECILLALTPHVLPDDEKSRELFIQQQRVSLLNNVNIGICKQEMYNYTIEGIQNYINSSTFLDPQKVIRLVEKVYDCNILLFAKNHQYPDGSMIVPIHTNGYCQFERDNSKPSIFIFMHLGSQKTLEYEHCELIIHTDEQTLSELKKNTFHPVQSFWTEKDNMYNFCWRVYDKLSEYYYSNNKIYRIPITTQQKLDIQGQYIDIYGKVRLIQIGAMVVETSPLPPFDVPLIENKLHAYEQDYVYTFMTHYCEKDGLFEYNILYNNVYYPQYIQGTFNGLFFIKMYIKSEQQIYVNQDMSLRTIYNNKLKIVRYLTIWMFYLFSQYINNNNIESIDKNIIQDFVKTNMIIDRNFNYDIQHVDETFKKENAKGLFKQNKLVCTSEILQNKLLFQLRLLIERNINKITTFSNRNTLEFYYIDKNDFKKYPNEYIMFWNPESKHTLKRLLRQTSDYYLVDTIPISNVPYFFQNHVITKENIVLSQNTFLNNAVSQNIVWNEQGYNPYDEIVNIDNLPSFYLYIVNKNGVLLKIIQVGKSPVKNNLSIMTHDNVYVPLMEL